MYYLGIDIGGMSIKCGLVNVEGDILVGLFKLLDLLEQNRCTGITLYTTRTLAVCEVAAEVLLKKVERNYCISNLYHKEKSCPLLAPHRGGTVRGCISN